MAISPGVYGRRNTKTGNYWRKPPALPVRLEKDMSFPALIKSPSFEEALMGD
jgi:hypothetical protein